MYPPPPQLFHGVGVTDDEAWESYWKVENGIRMSGMPGFKDTLSETQIWQAIVLVKNADNFRIREKRTHGGCEYFHGNDNALEQPRAEKEMN